MISSEEKEMIREFGKFFDEVYQRIESGEFLLAQANVQKWIEYFLKNKMGASYLRGFSQYFEWVRQKLDRSQYGKVKFDKDAEELVTLMNELALVLICQSVDAKDERERYLLLDLFDRLRDPIFIHLPENKPGFASFEHINADMEYYNREFKNSVAEFKKKYPQFSLQIEQFELWKSKKNEELANKWGLGKSG